MKLYYTTGACSLTIRIIINELKQHADYVLVNLQTQKTQNGDDFLSINPKGSVPVLVLDNDEILTENAVILQYLADEAKAYQLLPPVGQFARYRVLEWVNYVTTELHKGFAPLFNPTLDDGVKESHFIPLLKKKLTFVSKQLGEKSYLLGDEFTLPDAYLLVVLLWAKTQFGLKEWPNLMHYFERLLARDSIRRSFEEERLKGM